MWVGRFVCDGMTKNFLRGSRSHFHALAKAREKGVNAQNQPHVMKSAHSGWLIQFRKQFLTAQTSGSMVFLLSSPSACLPFCLRPGRKGGAQTKLKASGGQTKWKNVVTGGGFHASWMADPIPDAVPKSTNVCFSMVFLLSSPSACLPFCLRPGRSGGRNQNGQ